MEELDYISPIPKFWNEIHIELFKYWKNELNEKGSKPPVPLILAGWNFSDDWEKKARWLETIKWAKNNNCEYLIPKLTDNEKYFR